MAGSQNKVLDKNKDSKVHKRSVCTQHRLFTLSKYNLRGSRWGQGVRTLYIYYCYIQ